MTITPPNRQNLHVAEKEDARRIIPAQNSTAYFGPFNGWNLTPVSVSSILGGGKTFVCPASQRDISAPQKSTATQSNSLSNEHHNASKFIRAGKTTANRLTRQRAAKAGVDLHGEGYLRLEDVLKVYPVSRAAWYEGMHVGIYPQSLPLGKRSVGWTRESIRNLIANPPKF